MLQPPKSDERLFVRNNTEHSVTFAPSNLLVLKRSHGVWVDEYWPSFVAFRDDVTVLTLSSRGRIVVEYLKNEPGQAADH